VSALGQKGQVVLKILTAVVPCYNSEDYMSRCIEALLTGGDAMEIIVVDDGSSDATGAIADRYARENPQIVRAIHQPNGGHGAAINTGLAAATGTYFKVVDSDDWLDPAALQKALAILQTPTVDMLIANYVYDKVGKRHKRAMRYRHHLPENRIFGWDNVHLPTGKYLLMHSVIFKTVILQKMNLTLPRHTFYVDNLFVFEPLPHIQTMQYVDVDLYHYFIGRADQSVNENVMIKRIDQQLRVNRGMITYYAQVKPANKRLDRYMRSYVAIVTGISSIVLLNDGSAESLAQLRGLWHFMRVNDEPLYRSVRHSVVGRGINLPGRYGRQMTLSFYHLLQRFYSFN
jgi:glycosyltransferase involved in cell wall biosynthesis